MTDLITPWTFQQRAAFQAAPVKFSHAMADTGLFTDEALVRLLDRWPHELYDINLFDFDADGNTILRTGSRGRQSGEKVLEGIKEGRVWIQLRRADQGCPELGVAMRRAFEGISEQVRGFKAQNLNAQLIMSAPKAKVAFHADAPGVVLFHLRGKKRLWVYPSDESHMPQAQMENIALKQQTEDLPYNFGMDQNAMVFDLHPGEALSWPLHCPHRIENLGEFNVSLSVDFQTWGSRITNGAHYTNGLLRRWGVPVAAMDTTPVAARAALWAAHLGLKRLNLLDDKIKDLDRAFELDGAPITA